MVKPSSKPTASKSKKKPESSKLPGWVWLFAGVGCGMFLAFLFYLTTQEPNQNKLRALVSKESAPESASEGFPKFDFYTLLPGRDATKPKTDEKPAKKPETVAKAGPQQPAPSKSSSIIQTGSFRSAQEANQLRAELILLGLETNIKTIELKPGESWHRVQVGPFKNQSELEQAKQTLAENHVEHIVLRLK